MKIDLIFDDWRVGQESIYYTEEGVELSTWDFHSGSSFEGEIFLSACQEKELEEAIGRGYSPVFMIKIRHKEDNRSEIKGGF